MSEPATYAFAERSGSVADAPVLFVFHGTGGDEYQFLELGSQLIPGARVIAPRGDVSESGALRYFRRLAEGRYDMADLERATAKMAEFINARIGAERPRLVAGLGYSNGANILASVMFRSPDLFDSAALLHPLIPFEPPVQSGLAGKRVLITAGRRDPICPPQATQQLADWFGRQGAVADLFWHEGGHEVRPEELAAVQGFFAS